MDLPGAGIKGGKQMQRPGTFILMLHTKRLAGSSRESRSQAGTRLRIGFLVQTEDHLFPAKGHRHKSTKVRICSSLLVVTGHFRRPPEMGVPGFELVGVQEASDGGRRNAVDDPLGLEFAGQFGAIPLRERAPELIRAFTSQLDDLQGHWSKHMKAACAYLFSD